MQINHSEQAGTKSWENIEPAPWSQWAPNETQDAEAIPETVGSVNGQFDVNQTGF